MQPVFSGLLLYLELANSLIFQLKKILLFISPIFLYFVTCSEIPATAVLRPRFQAADRPTVGTVLGFTNYQKN